MSQTETEPRTQPRRHAAEQENMALLAGLIALLVAAVVLGALGVWGLRQHNKYEDAQDQIARLSEGQDAAQSELASAEGTIEDLRTFRASQDARLGACQQVLHVSVLQRAVSRGDREVRAINRFLHAHGHAAYDDLWDACRTTTHHEE